MSGYRFHIVLYSAAGILLLGLLLANVLFGSVDIPIRDAWNLIWQAPQYPGSEKWMIIIRESRIPQTITATLAGAALAVSGLLLQTFFRNPLAAPSILGISSGAGLGVAFATLFTGSAAFLGFAGNLAIIAGAMLGAMGVLGLIMLFSSWVKSNVMLLIIGLMISYLASSAVSLLSFYASADGVVSYVLWGMGNFSGIDKGDMPFFIGFTLTGLFASVLLIKPLNALLLGEQYSKNLGVNIRNARLYILFTTGLLTAIVTAFCGPVSFIGLAVPHIARLVCKSSSHNILVPLTILLGSITALLCNLLTVVLGNGTVIPLNVITPLMGAPVILYIIVNKKKIVYFN